MGLLCVIDYATLPNFQALEGILRMRYAKYAELLIALLPVGWMAAIYSRKRSNYILGTIVAATGWLAVMLSLSKGALLAGCIGFATTIVGSIAFSIRRFRPRLLASSGMLLILTIGVQVAFPMVFSIPSTADYISGKTGATRESSLSRVFVWLVGLKMVEEHLLTGVGADNFGERFNESRASYRMAHPNEPGVEFVSDGLVKRAHNEPLQVIAELGIIGIGLLGAAFFVFLAWVFRTLARTRLRASPMFWAAFGGMAAFGASSLVSSFSLRLVQNGIVFFLVFAVAVNEIMKAEGKAAIENTPFKLAKMATPVFAAISVLLVLMLATYGLKAAAEYMVFKADSETDSAAAAALYKSALRLDPDYASAYLRNSGRSYDRHEYRVAASELRKAIDRGMGVVITYSALASCYIKDGDMVAADRTFIEALEIFPRSVFLRVRYAIFLDDMSRIVDADQHFAIAYGVDSSQAKGWSNIIKNGSVAAYYAAKSDPAIASPVQLLPQAAVYEYLDENPAGAKIEVPN